MQLEDNSSSLRSSVRSYRSSRLSAVSSEASDKRRSVRGRRSSMSVKEIVDGTEVTKDVIIGDDMAKIDEGHSSLVSAKIAAIEEEEEHLMNYMEKLNNEKEQWDKMLQNYEKSADIAKKEVDKPILFSPKRIEEVSIEYMGIRDAPSSIEIALAMKPSLQKKAESQVLQNQKLKAEITVAEERLHRLQEMIKIQEKYLNYQSKDELLAQKAECDAVLLQIENWVTEHGFSERLAAI
ncbi:hypothetical protein QQG55_13060 [Brugia pahangi]